MSDFTAILLILGTFGFTVLCLVLCMTRAHHRMDEVVSGVVNGVPIATKYRWLLFLFDFLGYANVAVVLLSVFAVGFYAAAQGVADSAPRILAYFCAAACAFGVFAVLFPVAFLSSYMVSVLRQAEAD